MMMMSSEESLNSVKKPRLITVGRGRGKVPPQIPPQSRLGLALQLGAVRQDENSRPGGDHTPTSSQEGQFEKLKEELELLNIAEAIASSPPPPPVVGGISGGPEIKTSQMRVPKNKAGAILGQGGKRIQRIQAESGARKIWLDNIVNENNEKILTIEGTDDQIEQARLLLGQSMRKEYRYRVKVTGLPRTCRWQDLKDHMNLWFPGDVTCCNVKKGFKNSFGVVKFFWRKDMETAIKKLDKSPFKSRQVSEVIAGDITFFIDFQGEISYIRVREVEDVGSGMMMTVECS